jgi:hypothetical protein
VPFEPAVAEPPPRIAVDTEIVLIPFAISAAFVALTVECHSTEVMTQASAVLERHVLPNATVAAGVPYLYELMTRVLSIVDHVAELSSLARTGIREITDDALVCRKVRVGELGQELQRESAYFGG